MNHSNENGAGQINSVMQEGPPRKRGKYVQAACIECKRRKLKCTGEPKCWRCIDNGVTCTYPQAGAGENNATSVISSPRSDALEARVAATEAQLSSLSAEIAQLRKVIGLRNAASSSEQATPAQLPVDQYLGPTSNGFGINMVKSSLALMDPMQSPRVNSNTQVVEPCTPMSYDHDSTLDVLRSLGIHEVLRLLDIYEQRVGSLYPCLDVESVKRYATDLLVERRDSRATMDGNMDSWYLARDLQVLKIILATALMSENYGESQLGVQLAYSVENQIYGRINIAEVDMKELMILAILCFYYFFRDEEVLAYRVTGFAARGCFEMGLHRQDTWTRSGGNFPGELQRSWAVKLFWCIYVLDRRWSFGTGMPFAFQDSDIDTNLPEPDPSADYLKCMIAHGRLAGKIWTAVMSSQARPLSAEETNFLDFQIQAWRQSIPEEYRFIENANIEEPQQRTRILQQALMELRANQMRIVVHRDHLLSSARIFSNEAAASLAVEVARDTIQVLDRMNIASNLYNLMPGPFNYFLVSALAVLFLAICHAPVLFSGSTRKDYHKATELLKGCSGSARGSPRLRKLINDLRAIGSKLGLSSRAVGERIPLQNSYENPALSTHQIHATLTDNTSAWKVPVQPGRFDVTSDGNIDLEDQQDWDLGDMFLAAGDPFFPELGEGISENTNTFPDPTEIFGFENDQQLTDIIANLLR